MSPLIEAADLRKEYAGGVHALRGVSVSVGEREFVAVMGASGSGKSTLLHVIGTLDSADSGTLRYEGVALSDIPDLDRFRATNLGFVFQLHFLLPHLSLLDNVTLPLKTLRMSQREREALAMTALGRVGLAHRVRHTPARISGGERQRAAIARAIVNRPTLLLADEPTGNVDSRTEASLLELFEEIRRDLGTTLLIVTHNAAVAARADRVLYMRDGLLVSREEAALP